MACNIIVRFALEHKNASCAWIAPWFRQAKIVYRLIRKALRKLITYKSDAELRIEFANGSVIQFFSTENHDAIRGNGFHYLVIDEAGDALRDPQAWTESIRATLSDTNGEALIIGTPKGRNLFFQLFSRGEDPEYPDWQSFHAPSSANPYIRASEIESVRKEIPEDAYEQEYLAVFKEDSAGVFRGIDACISGELDEDYEPVKGHDYVMGWDPAKYLDYSVVTLIDCHTRAVVGWKRINQIDYIPQIEMVSALAARFKAVVYMDVTGVGAPLAEQLKTKSYSLGFRVEEYLFTNASKKILVEGLQIAIQHKEISFPDIPVLTNELRIYEYQMTPSRNITYGAPKGAHDDAATSLMLAAYGMAQPRGPMMWSLDEDKPVRTLEMAELPENKPYRMMEIDKPITEDEGEWVEIEY